MTDKEANAIRQQLAIVEASLQQVRQTITNLLHVSGGEATGCLEGLNPTQLDILNALAARPQSSKALARASGHTYSGWFRINLAQLVEQGLVQRTRKGYRRP